MLTSETELDEEKKQEKQGRKTNNAALATFNIEPLWGETTMVSARS